MGTELASWKNMKHKDSLAFVVLFALVGLTPQARAAHSQTNGQFGLGVELGEPTGLSAKYRINSRDAVDFGLAYSFNSFVEVFSDYLYHFPGVFGSSSQFVTQLTPYLGIGGVFFDNTGGANSFYGASGSSAGLGLRIPLGIEWRPGRPPLGVFVELVPGLGIIPSTFGFFQGGIGIRFYF